MASPAQNEQVVSDGLGNVARFVNIGNSPQMAILVGSLLALEDHEAREGLSPQRGAREDELAEVTQMVKKLVNE